MHCREPLINLNWDLYSAILHFPLQKELKPYLSIFYRILGDPLIRAAKAIFGGRGGGPFVRMSARRRQNKRTIRSEPTNELSEAS